MGVPGFFRWICQRYPMIKRKMADPSRPAINNLFLDVNGIFYKALAATGAGNEELSPSLLAEIFRYMDMLVQLTRPSDLIFIAVDGPAPNAKASQQRSRRFVAARNHSTNSFDRTQISPGTVFMDKLNDALLEFIQDKVKNDLVWSKAKVIYSNAFAPGEGEHKILDYIREQRAKPEWDPNQVHCMYSTDADLLFLGLQTHEPNVLILRESDAANYQKEMQPFEASVTKLNYSFESFELIHFPILRQYMTIDFGCNPMTLERIIDDFIAISFLIGNDFIPEFYDIDIRKGDFNDIVDLYKVFNDSGSKFIIENGEFIRENLKEFLSQVVNMFKKAFKEHEKIETDEEADEAYTEKNKEYLRERYPLKVEQDFDSLCYDMACGIMDAFNWVLKYYTSGCPSWTWSYPFLYAPPLEFILPYIEDYESEFEEGEPNLPFMQQLLIFPPQSSHLMPEPLGKLMFPPSPIAQYYPEEFKTDLNGRHIEWLAVVVIPLLEYDEIREEYDKAIKEVDPEDLKRNRFDDPIEFYKGEQRNIKITKGTPFVSKDLSTKAPDCTPTLFTLDFQCETRVVPVKIFEFPSRNPSVVIKVKPKAELTAKDAIPLLGKQVLTGYPYLRPAIVVGAIDQNNYLDQQGNLKPRPESVNFPKENRENFLLQSRGLEISITCFLVVKPYIYFSTNGESLDFDSKTELFPTATMVPITSTAVGLRYQKKEIPPIAEGETVVLWKGEGRGCVGKVVKVNDENSVDVEVIERDHPPNIKKLLTEDNREWTTFKEITKKNGISFRALQLALTSVNVDGINVAFNLFTRNKRQIIDGYARLVGERGDVEISITAADLIPQYFQHAGKLKELLIEKTKSNDRSPASFTKQDLFPRDTERLYDQFVKWLAEKSPAAFSPLVSSNSESLTVRGTRSLENVLEKYKVMTNKTILDHVPMSSIIRREGPREQIENQKLGLCTRVVCVASSGSVPFGTYGTLVGYDTDSRTVTVVFDSPLATGTKLDGRLRTNRGMRLMEREIFVIY